MAETSVEKQVCPSCAAIVRPGALFCYNCGGAVPVAAEKLEIKNGNGSDGSASKRKNALPTQVKEKKIVGETTEIGGAAIDKPQSSAETELKSAAAMRRKPKSFQKKEVEIVWEEQENPSSLLLIATALLLAVFAAAVIILAMSLK